MTGRPSKEGVHQMLNDQFLELLRRQLNSEEEKRIPDFHKKLSQLKADRYAKNMYHSSITLGLLTDLVNEELKETGSWIANAIIELYSKLGKGYRPSLGEDLKEQALLRFEQYFRSWKVFLLEEAKTITSGDDLQRHINEKFELESSRIRNNLILGIDLYVATLIPESENHLHWFKDRIKFVHSSIRFPIRLFLILYSILGAITFIRDEFLSAKWRKNPVITYCHIGA